MASTRKKVNNKNKTRGRRLMQKGGFLENFVNFFGNGNTDGKKDENPNKIFENIDKQVPVQVPVPEQKIVGGKKNKKSKKR